MATPFRLQKVLELYELRLESAAEALARTNQTLTSAQARLRQLEHFVLEYQQARLEKMQQGVSAGQLGDFEVFLRKLKEAQNQQTRVVVDARQKKEVAQNFWQEKRREVDALKLLRQRHQSELFSQENRREQRLFDEFAAVSWRSNQQNQEIDDSENNQ